MVDRTVIWNILRYYDIPQEIVNIIKCLFEDIGSRVIYSANLSVPFIVNRSETGQLYSVPTRVVTSNPLGDETNSGRAKRHSMDPLQKLKDLDFSDEVNLLSNTLGDVARTATLEFNAMSQFWEIEIIQQQCQTSSPVRGRDLEGH